MLVLQLPITLLANECFFKVANPRSPILINPVEPLTKILSHLRSRWMIGGVRVCKKYSPSRIWRHQLFKTFSRTPLNLLRYLKIESRKTDYRFWIWSISDAAKLFLSRHRRQKRRGDCVAPSMDVPCDYHAAYALDLNLVDVRYAIILLLNESQDLSVRVWLIFCIKRNMCCIGR